MKTTYTLPTDKNGNIYHGAKTVAEAQQHIAEGADAYEVYTQVKRAGYKWVAGRIKTLKPGAFVGFEK